MNEVLQEKLIKIYFLDRLLLGTKEEAVETTEQYKTMNLT